MPARDGWHVWRAVEGHGIGRGVDAKPPGKPRALGALIALLAVGGAIGGGLLGQPSIGLLAGIGTGALLAILFWLVDRRS